jgi:hypothetical protein
VVNMNGLKWVLWAFQFMLCLGNATAGNAEVHLKRSIVYSPLAPGSQSGEAVFEVQNDSNEVVTIKKADGGCGCVKCTIVKSELLPGERTRVLVRSATKGRKELYVEKVLIALSTGAVLTGMALFDGQ